MCHPLCQGHHTALHALLPLRLLLLSAGSTHLQPGPLRFMIPVSPEELSSADVDMEEEDLEEDEEEDAEEDMDPGEAVAQQIIQQAPAVPVELADQSIGWGAPLPCHCYLTTPARSSGDNVFGVGASGCLHCCLSALLADITLVPWLCKLNLA